MPDVELLLTGDQVELREPSNPDAWVRAECFEPLQFWV